MISLKHKFLFLHIPKTAGNSIQNILKDYSEEKVVRIAPHQDGVERFELRSDSYVISKHSTLCDYQDQLGKEVVNGLFKFTCVRNPWDRMISFYFSPHRGVVSWDRNKFIKLVNNIAPAICFVKNERNMKPSEQCFNNMDKCIRFESLQIDFDSVCARIGIPPQQLPKRNVSNHQHYSSYYDAALIDLVRNRFRYEIDYFGFEYESTPGRQTN